MRPTATSTTLKGSHIPGTSYDPFRVESLMGVHGSVGGATLAHGYNLSAFQAESVYNIGPSGLRGPTRAPAR